MITQEHLEHWIKEINWQLNGILNEVAESKLKGKKGIDIKISPQIDEDVYVSFEYILEKATTIWRTLHCIEDDIKND